MKTIIEITLIGDEEAVDKAIEDLKGLAAKVSKRAGIDSCLEFCEDFEPEQPGRAM